MSVSLSFHLLRTFKTRGKAYPHWKKSCLLTVDKFSVITNILQVRMVCRNSTSFGRSWLIFKRTADKICPSLPFHLGRGRVKGTATRRLGKPHLNSSPIFPQAEKRAFAAYSANNKNLLVNYLSR